MQMINGVFEGGGVKGIALAGAVSAVMNKGYRFRQVAGTSSGSMVAAFLAAGFTGTELKHIIGETPFQSFLKRSWFHNIPLVGPGMRLFLKQGLYSSDALEEWVRKQLAKKRIHTFGDLRPGQLRIVASDISHGKLLVLPDDIAQYDIDPKQFSVARAVRMSCSIPYFFDPVIIRQATRVRVSKKRLKRGAGTRNVFIVDGGVLSNFPLWLFDHEVQHAKRELVPTLGFSLVGRSGGYKHDIKDPFTMLQALFATMMDAHDERYIEKHNHFRTIKIPANHVHTTEFDLSPEKSESLYYAGYEAADQFMQTWSVDKYRNDFHKFVLRT